MPRPDSSFNGQFETLDRKLTDAVKSYWQVRFPGRPGRVLIVDRRNTARKAAA